MLSEFIDIVDENNIPLNITKERSLVHRDGDWHNTVHIYVLNDKNEFLVHLRAQFKDLYPNCWDTRFGGHILAGDTIEKTAVREIKEEIGLNVKYEDLVKGTTYKYDGKTNREFNNVYYYAFRKNDVIKFNDNEVVEVKWMAYNEIIKSLQDNPKIWSTRIGTVQRIYSNYIDIKNKYYAGGFLYNPKTRAVLLHKRDLNTKVNPNKWAFFGGLNEGQETPQQTFAREINEELNIKISEDKIVPLCNYFNEELQTHRYVFYIESDLDKSQMNLTEGEDFDWIPLDKVFEYNLTDKTVKDLKLFLQTRK